MNFFAWFAHSTGYAYLLGLVKLKIILKNVLLILIYNKIRRRDKRYFKLIKQNI
jgi:hypothetical protein